MSLDKAIYRCKRPGCGAMFDDRALAEKHAEEEFRKIFPDSRELAIPQKKAALAKKKSKIAKAGLAIEKGAQAWNRGLENFSNTVNEHYDFNKVFERVTDMSMAYDLFGVKKRGQGNKKDV